jgi:hypothetical protein
MSARLIQASFFPGICLCALLTFVLPVCPIRGAEKVTGKAEVHSALESRIQELTAKEDFTLADAFRVLGDPEDICQLSWKGRGYGWGLAPDAHQSVLIDAIPGTNRVQDWLVSTASGGGTRYRLLPGDSRENLAPALEEMRRERLKSQPSCPGALWCAITDRTKINGTEFDVLRESDRVGPCLQVILWNTGIGPVRIPVDLTNHILLVVETPDGKTHTNRLTLPAGFSETTLVPDQGIVADGSLLSRVATDTRDSNTPLGRYRYYAVFSGAKSHTGEAEVHRLAFVLPSPNDPAAEISITPFYEKFPIHVLTYEELLDRCKKRLSQRYEGSVEDVLISAYEMVYRPGPRGTGTMGGKRPRDFPLRDFGTIVVRKRAAPDSAAPTAPR